MVSLVNLNVLGTDYSPAPHLSRLSIGAGDNKRNIFVVRDDKLPGGTKQRALIPYIQDLIKEGHHHFIYASPISGFAQVALAYVCQELGVKCTLFYQKNNQSFIQEFIDLSKSYNAHTVECESFDFISHYLLSPTSQTKGQYLIPSGFQDPRLKSYLKKKLKEQWDKLSSQYDFQELWLPVGSGNLANIFDQIIPKSININLVNLNVLPKSDLRIRELKNNQRFQYFNSFQDFHRRCKNYPPIPSNPYYDAKLFEIIWDKAAPGALWWNVAK